MSVVATQCVLTLVAALGTPACFVRVDRQHAYHVAFATVDFTSSMHSVVFDTTLLTESLYSSLVRLSFGKLPLAILRGGAWACAAASFAMTSCLLTRPAGFFLFVIHGLVLGWLLLRRQPRRHALAFALPLAIVVLATCAYNRLTIGAFTVTPFGAENLLGALATYIEEAPRLAIGRQRGGAGDSRQHGTGGLRDGLHLSRPRRALPCIHQVLRRRHASQSGQPAQNRCGGRGEHGACRGGDFLFRGELALAYIVSQELESGRHKRPLHRAP